MKNKIYPCLWFDGKAKEAAEFYCSVFRNSQITDENPLVVNFQVSGQKFMLLNGGPQFKINPSISFYVVCESLDEIDSAWEKLIEGGSALMPFDKYPWSEKYGWLQDRYGVNWQLSYGNMQEIGQRFTPALMFTQEKAGQAEQAISFYTSLFNDASIIFVDRYSSKDSDVEGTVKHGQFKLESQLFMTMDSSYPHAFKYNEAVSFVVECENQDEIDYYWEKLSAVPEAEQCGWLKDQYGVSWQIIPSVLRTLMSDQSRVANVVNSFLHMKKLDIEELLNA